MFYTIYQTKNKINGKIYIGMHQTEDLDDGYLGSGLVLKETISKYGKSNFEKKILFVFDNKNDMINKEKELVTEEFIKLQSNYNQCIGGSGGPLRKGIKLSEETKQKISKNTKIALQDSKIQKHLSKIRKGKKHTKESKDKMSRSRKNKKWISCHRTETTKMINSSELKFYLDLGWVIGRKYSNPFVGSNTNFKK